MKEATKAPVDNAKSDIYAAKFSELNEEAEQTNKNCSEASWYP